MKLRINDVPKAFCYPPETKVLRIGHLAFSQEQIVEKTVEKNTALLSEQDRLADGRPHSKWAIFRFLFIGIGTGFYALRIANVTVAFCYCYRSATTPKYDACV